VSLSASLGLEAIRERDRAGFQIVADDVGVLHGLHGFIAVVEFLAHDRFDFLGGEQRGIQVLRGRPVFPSAQAELGESLDAGQHGFERTRPPAYNSHRAPALRRRIESLFEQLGQLAVAVQNPRW
jgi:hypothetical protein